MVRYFVIKCGGSIMEKLSDTFYADIVQVQQEGNWQPIIVHGGGPLISAMLDKMNIPTHFVDGLRVTTEDVLDVVEFVLSGSANKEIVRKLSTAGGQGIGLSGVDGQLLQAVPSANAERIGFVGDVHAVNHSLIETLSENGYIPVISPIGIGLDGQRYNINGDVAAAAVAKALQAKLCMISNIPGIYGKEIEGQEREVLHEVTEQDVQQLIADEVITGGMIPKVQSAIDALRAGVPEVSILNGISPHVIRGFCAGEAVGTTVTLEKEAVHHVK